MARFILHVGDMKCGSTSIQASLKRARAALAQKGLIYDVGEIGHSRFSVLHLVRPHSRGNLETFLARGRRIVAQLRETVTDDDVVLLSAEGLLAIPPEDFLPVLRQIEPGDPDISSLPMCAARQRCTCLTRSRPSRGAGNSPSPMAMRGQWIVF